MKKLLLFLLLAGCTTAPPVQELPESDYCRLSLIPTKLLIEGAEILINEPYMGHEGVIDEVVAINLIREVLITGGDNQLERIKAITGDTEETLSYLGTRALVLCSLSCLGKSKQEACNKRFGGDDNAAKN